MRVFNASLNALATKVALSRFGFDFAFSSRIGIESAHSRLISVRLSFVAHFPTKTKTKTETETEMETELETDRPVSVRKERKRRERSK